jgi:hypothetical protein
MVGSNDVVSFVLVAYCLQNKNATNCNPKHMQMSKQALLLSSLEEDGVRGVHSNF